jgi:hypothetical protein
VRDYSTNQNKYLFNKNELPLLILSYFLFYGVVAVQKKILKKKVRLLDHNEYHFNKNDYHFLFFSYSLSS